MHTNEGNRLIGNRDRDEHCEFNQHRKMAGCSNYVPDIDRVLWRLSRKSGATNNFRQKCTTGTCYLKKN